MFGDLYKGGLKTSILLIYKKNRNKRKQKRDEYLITMAKNNVKQKHDLFPGTYIKLN